MKMSSPLVIVGVLLCAVLISVGADVKHILPQNAQGAADPSLNAINPSETKTCCLNSNVGATAPVFGSEQGEYPQQLTPNDVAFWWLGKDSPFLQAYEYFRKCTEKGNCVTPVQHQSNLPQNGCNANGCSYSGSFNINEQASGGKQTGPIDLSKNPFLNGNFQGIAISSENGKPLTTITTCQGPKCKTSSINGVPSTPLNLQGNPFLNGGNFGAPQPQPPPPPSQYPPCVHGQAPQLLTPTVVGGDYSTNPFLQNVEKVSCNNGNTVCVQKHQCVDGFATKRYDNVQSPQYCDASRNEVCCKVAKTINFGDITGVIPGQNHLPGSTFKIPGGPGISPGLIQVVPDNAGAASTVSPSYGHAGSFNLRPTNPSGFTAQSSNVNPNAVAVSNGNPFSTTIDYTNVQFAASDINSAASPFHGPGYLPPGPSPKPDSYRPPTSSSAPLNIFTNQPPITSTYPTTTSTVRTPSSTDGYSYQSPTPTFNPYVTAAGNNDYQYVSTQKTSPPAITNNQYLPPHDGSIENVYIKPTPRPFVPPPPSVTQRPYVPPPPPPRPSTTTRRPYVSPPPPTPPSTTTRRPYVPPPPPPPPSTTTRRPYVTPPPPPPTTTRRPYVPPPPPPPPSTTTKRPYFPPPVFSTSYKPSYVPSTTTYRPPPHTFTTPRIPFVPVTYLPPVKDIDSDGNDISGQYVGLPTRPPPPPPTISPPSYLPPRQQQTQPPYDPDRFGEGANAGVAFAGLPKAPEDPAGPYAGCAAALVCVQEIYCTAEGTISSTPVVLSREQEVNRVPLTECQDKQAGIIGKCCRDPNYKDPWPSTKLVNGFDDGQYHEDDSIAQYQPSKNLQGAATNTRYKKRSNNQIAAVDNQPLYSSISNPTCGTRNYDTAPKGTAPLEVNFAEITWQAMILRDSNRSLLCGGAIIRLDAVLTAAHCVEGMDSSDVLIKGGEWKLGIDEEPQPFQIVKVAAIIRHPQYVPGGNDKRNDLVVLKLTERLRPAKNVGTICLGQVGQPVLDENCIATGWGKKILQIHLQGAIMRSVDVNLLSSQDCEAKLDPHTLQQHYSSRYLCGQSQSNQCDIDIGSALACRGPDGRYSLSGILTWDTGCKGPSQIGGYLAPDTNWLENTLSRPLNLLREEERQYLASIRRQ